MANELFGIQQSITKVSTNKLNNQTLLNALDFKSEKNIVALYSDLDLTLGNISAQFIFSKIPVNERITFQIMESEWESLKEICQISEDTFGLKLIIGSIKAIDESLSVKKKAYLEAHKGGNIKSKSILVTTNIEMDFNSIKSFFTIKRGWVIEQISILNKLSTPIELYRSVLNDLDKFFNFLELLYNDRNISKAFKPSNIDKEFKDLNSLLRIKIPIKKLFSTGNNFVVLGEAGAGKTTCLQMHARHCLSDKTPDNSVLFLPLAPIIFNYKKKDRFNEKISSIEHLTSAIIEYYRLEGIKLTNNNLEDLFENSNALLLFDGIDEVMNSATWILDAIHSIAKRYPKSQIICSARTGGQYLSEIHFLGINLLPFTDEQRSNFFSNWFENKDDSRINKIVLHLKNNPKLSEIVRSPLLSTILCVLTEHGVELPESEIHLYQERFRLLLGHYDIHKQSIRISSTQHLLSIISRKLAFEFHEKKIREMEFDILKETVIKIAPKGTSEQKISIALNELIYPCNILVPMSHRKNFGFGHFRYQEYLSALELVKNRGIDVSQYLTQEWWRGCLVLFAQITDNIEFLVKNAIDLKTITEAKPTIESILNVRSSEEKDKYLPLINKALAEEDYIRSRSSQR